MKVLSIHWGLSLGGVAKYAATIDSVHERAPIRIRSLCILPEGRVVDEEVLRSLDAIVFRVRSAFDPTWISAVRYHIAAETPDCILSHGFNGHLVSLVAGGAWRPAPTRLATYHGSYHATTRLRRLLEPVYNEFTHWFLRTRASSVLSVAQYCADYLVMHGVNNDKVTVVHNGIPDLMPDAGARESIRAEWGVGPENILIGAVSRLDPVKGLTHLIDAFADVGKKHPHAWLVIVGDGASRESLEVQAAELGMQERILFTGMRTDVARCLAALDIFVLPSLAEYHSIALLEAMRAGLPIIATSVGGNAESISNGRDGLVIPPAETGSLVAALDQLLNNADLRTRLGKSARQRFINEFTEEAMLENTANWFMQVCSGQSCVSHGAG